MRNKEDLKTLIAENQRRLQKRKVQQARFGINAPPEVLIEIEDIETEIEQLQAELEGTNVGAFSTNDKRDDFRRSSMPRRKVTVNIEGGKNLKLKTAGKDIIENAQAGYTPGSESSDVEVTLKDVEDVTLDTAGSSIVRFAKIAEPLQELKALISENLQQQDQIEDLQEIIADLEDQAQKPAEGRSASKIKRLLDGVGTYLGLATLATTQAQHAQQLFETVKGLLTGG